MVYRRSPLVNRPFLTSWDWQSDANAKDYYKGLHSELAISPTPVVEKILKRKSPPEQDDDITLFRRVRIKSFITRSHSDERAKEDVARYQSPILSNKCSCRRCASSFSQHEHLDRNAHANDKPNLCLFPGCTKRFGMLKQRLRHTIEKHKKEYQNEVSYNNLEAEVIVAGVTILGGTRSHTIDLNQVDLVAFNEQQKRVCPGLTQKQSNDEISFMLYLRARGAASQVKPFRKGGRV